MTVTVPGRHSGLFSGRRRHSITVLNHHLSYPTTTGGPAGRWLRAADCPAEAYGHRDFQPRDGLLALKRLCLADLNFKSTWKRHSLAWPGLRLSAWQPDSGLEARLRVLRRSLGPGTARPGTSRHTPGAASSGPASRVEPSPTRTRRNQTPDRVSERQWTRASGRCE